jgi:hypothetical protein
MKLVQVQIGQQWLLGVLDESAMPEPTPEESAADAIPQPLVIADAAMVLHVPMPVETDSVGGRTVNVMVVTTLVAAGLPSPVVVDYGEVAPPLAIVEVDEARPPEHGLVRRYLEFRRQLRALEQAPPSSADGGGILKESKRTRLS